MGAVLAVLKAIQMLGECDDQDYNALSPSDSHADGAVSETVNGAANPTAASTGSSAGGSGVTNASGEAASTGENVASGEVRKDADISISSLLGNMDELDDFSFTGNASTPGGGGGGGGGSTPGGGRTPGGGNGANTPAKTGGAAGSGGATDALAIGAAVSLAGAGGAGAVAGSATGASGNPTAPQKSDIGSLTEFAKLVLRTMCGQEWVRERCLQDPESLFQQQHLLDPCLSQSQTRHLLHLICYPGE